MRTSASAVRSVPLKVKAPDGEVRVPNPRVIACLDLVQLSSRHVLPVPVLVEQAVVEDILALNGRATLPP